MLTLGIICPCYNEEEVLYTSAEILSNYLNQLVNKNKISKHSFVLLVNDGSKDKTWEIINNLYNQRSYFKGGKFSIKCRTSKCNNGWYDDSKRQMRCNNNNGCRFTR